MNKEHEAALLIKQYINIANGILLQQKDSMALAGVVALLERMLAGDDISIKVTDEDGSTMAWFSTRFGAGQFAPPHSGRHGSDRVFEVSRSYLQQVVDNAQDYMEHPGKLDWDWLTGRVSQLDSNGQE